MTTANLSQSVLRLTTAGSVDDGKSTLIGRLLYASGALLDDQLAALSKQRGGELDLSHVTDGLKSEREQGITIDVAYKYFATKKRKFILADAPGHLQFTRNMVTAASRADAAIILVDACRGIDQQTRRHSYLLHLLQVPHIVLAINKIDLIGYDQNKIEAIDQEFRQLSWNVGHPSLQTVPVSALRGDFIAVRSAELSWYTGPTLLELLEGLAEVKPAQGSMRLPVQMVLRSSSGGRFAAGTLTHGSVEVGDAVRLYPSQIAGRVAELYVHGVSASKGVSGQAVAVRLEGEQDLGRGDLLVQAEAPVASTSRFSAHLVWFDDAPWRPRSKYLLRLATQETKATIDHVSHRFDLEKLVAVPAESLSRNDIAVVSLSTAAQLFALPYATDRAAGAFVLIDPGTHRTVAAGMILQDLEDGKAGGQEF